MSDTVKFAGALMIIAAFALAGRLRAADLKARARTLSALVSALEILRGEVVSRLAPLPEAAERLAETGPEETRGFFALLTAELPQLGEREFSAIWSDCVETLSLRETEREALRSLGRSIGRYGAQEQDAALARCMETVGAAAERAREEAVSGGKLWAGLGLTAGLLLAIMLI